MDLLIELFSEEIPARMQGRAADDLRRLMTDGLVEAGLTYAHAGALATPRRLVLAVEGLTPHSPTTREERKGPRTDAPAAAIEGFLRSTGLTADQLERRADKKAEVFFAVIDRPGRPAAEIVADVLGRVIRDFPWPKSMRWGAGPLRWVRPLHAIIAQLTDEAGSTVVPFEIEGIRAGDTTRGHRFMAPDAITVSGFADYAAKLRAARVMLDPAERREAIRHEADQLAFARGWEIVPDDPLLTEIAGLVEWPVPLMGEIEARFLGLPPEVLQTSMREHQKFLSARNPKTGRIEGFVTVANIEATDGGAAILAGNRRVLAARLSDAAFFWDNDLREARAGMAAWAEAQKAVTFHAKLGTEHDRIARIAALAREIAPHVGADPDLAEQAAKVAKLDLRSGMVGEFPELQGIMGRAYATAAGLPPEVAAAAADHYAPRGPDEPVPTAPVSVAVALADKLNTLTGFWAVDEKPTGSKDPFALRRAALGTIRALDAIQRNVPLAALIRHHVDKNALAFASGAGIARRATLSDGATSVTHYRNAVILGDQFPTSFGADRDFIVQHFEEGHADLVRADENGVPAGPFPKQADFAARVSADLLAFLHDRLKQHLRDEGIRHDVLDAVLALPGNDDLTAVAARARALNAMLATADGPNLLQGLKRAANILAQAEEKDGVEYSYGADPKFAETAEERTLFAALDAAEPRIREAVAREDFPAAMSAIAALRAPVDAFFEAVQVNTDSQVVRRNRLNLLSRIREAGRLIADFGRIEG